MENRKEVKTKVQDFTELRAWQAARKLRLDVYRLIRSTKKLKEAGRND